jgi:hypothetical protein
MGVYAPGKRTGVSGWAAHPVCLFWRGFEAELAKYALALSEEMLYNRALNASSSATSLLARRQRVSAWKTLYGELLERDFPEFPPVLVGDDEFHSAFRSLLLYKDIQHETFTNYKRGKYPKHLATKDLPPKKPSWKREDYERIWEYFGRPDPVWYAQWGWVETPDPDKVFYHTNRVPYIEYRKKRKAEKPYIPFMTPRTT